MQVTKEQRFGLISTLIFVVSFILLLMFFGFTTPLPLPEEEGILINFGTSQTGSGNTEPKPAENNVQEENNATTPASEITTPTETREENITQDYVKTAALEEEKRKKKEQQEIKQKKIAEQKRLDEIEHKKQEELKRQEKIKQDNQNRAKNAFGGKNQSGDNTGEGDNQGKGNQGDPNGSINSKNRIGGANGGNGTSFSLNGRSSKSLPKPKYNIQAEGKVVVEVSVDQNGNVLKARPGVKGTTTSNKVLHESARKAALKATFDVNKNAPAVQKGTITYHFSLE